MNYLELAVGVAIILMPVYLRYFAGLKTGWELVMFWVYWIVGIRGLNRSSKRLFQEYPLVFSSLGFPAVEYSIF